MSTVLFLAVVATSCGVEPGYETLDVRYDGVPINLDVAVATEVGAGDATSSSGASESADDTTEPLGALASATPEEVPMDVSTETESRDHEAHRDPAPTPGVEAALVGDGAELQVVESDARRASKTRQRALRSFKGLVANATDLRARQVNCLVKEVDRSGVNPVPMNRALRRALAGSEATPAPRYVALAQSAAAACGVSLSESLLR